jgi:DNA-binding transcriptional LysR family regulator
MKMTLEQLRIFVAVAEREHVTRGARDLNLTQSATSAAVAALEARYATKLFDRVGRRIALTEAGKLFLAEAKAVLCRAEKAETVLADLSGLKRGTLSLAASQTIANYWLPAILHEYVTQYPGIQVTLSIGNTETVSTQIHEGTTDLGFIEGEVDDGALDVQSIAEDQMILVAAPGHPWASATPDPMRDFAAANWICREQGSGTRAMSNAALSQLGLCMRDFHIVLELPSNESIRAAVEAGAGVTIISRLVVWGSLNAGTLVQVPLDLPKRRFQVLRHKERYITQAERALYRLLSMFRKPGETTALAGSAACCQG